jgi:hypothetical protein
MLFGPVTKQPLQYAGGVIFRTLVARQQMHSLVWELQAVELSFTFAVFRRRK